MSPHLLSVWKQIQRTRRDDNGALAVEFALVTPVLLLLFTGMVEGSLLFYTWGNMENVGRQAARGAAIGELSTAQAESLIKTRMLETTGAPNVTAVVTFSKGTIPVDNAVTVDVTLPASELPKILPFGIFRGFDLRTVIRTYWEIG